MSVKKMVPPCWGFKEQRVKHPKSMTGLKMPDCPCQLEKTCIQREKGLTKFVIKMVTE